MENAKPQMKEVLLQVPKLNVPKLESLAKNISNFVLETNKLNEGVASRKISQQQLKNSVVQLVRIYVESSKTREEKTERIAKETDEEEQEHSMKSPYMGSRLDEDKEEQIQDFEG